MALETRSSNELLNFIIYDTIFATPYSVHGHDDSLVTNFSLENNTFRSLEQASSSTKCRSKGVEIRSNLEVQGRKKRRRKATRVLCKNKEEAETKRMTHIAVERNRRKQMNEHLCVLCSLMPQSYLQRGDQASIVGGATEFVKELEHVLQTLEAQKLQVLNQVAAANEMKTNNSSSKMLSSSPPPFAQFFMCPQYPWAQIPNEITSITKASIADIEVTLIQTNANLLTKRSQTAYQAAFHSLHLSILHLNVTSMDTLVLYSISAKVEEGCRLSSVDDIAGAVHNMLIIIEEDATSTTLC